MKKRTINGIDYFTNESDSMIWELLKAISADSFLYTKLKREKEIEEGLIFTWQTSIQILKDQTKYILWDTTKTNRKITFNPILLFATSGTIKVNFRIFHNYSGGIEQYILNHNNNSQRKTETLLTVGAAGTNDGIIATTIDVGTQATNQSSGGGSVQSRDKVIINNQITYLLECINLSGNNTYLSTLFTWKEEDN